MRPRSIFVLFNPSAGRGRCGRRVDALLELLRAKFGEFEHAVTTRAGEEDDLVDRALERGHDAIVAVGGDGTWSRAADRILRSGRGGVALGLLAGGTGNDFGKSVGVRFERSAEIVAAIAEGRRRRVDVGRVGGRHFLNVVGFGFDIAVIDDAAGMPLLHGDILYRFCALRQLFRFPGLPLRLCDSRGGAAWKEYLMVVVANGRFFGGSFRIAPRADLRDGRLDLVAISNAGPVRRARLFGLVAGGRHEGAPEVETRSGPRFRIGLRPPLRYELDGEVLTCRDDHLIVESVPDALDLLVP